MSERAPTRQNRHFCGRPDLRNHAIHRYGIALLRAALLAAVGAYASCVPGVDLPPETGVANVAGCDAPSHVADVKPELTCTAQDGLWNVAVFGYDNTATDAAGNPLTVTVPPGPANFLSPGPIPGYSPGRTTPISVFQPGHRRMAFAVRTFSSLPLATWHLSAAQSAASGIPVCQQVTEEGVTYLTDGAGQSGDRIEISRTPSAGLANSIEPTDAPMLGGYALGTVAGTFQVGPDGDATYAIPIQVPPGRAGLQPSLALAYNSRGGNGILGVGWSLSGLSQISRCDKSAPDIDHAADTVHFDATDDFCLDGDTLVPAPVTGTTVKAALRRSSGCAA